MPPSRPSALARRPSSCGPRGRARAGDQQIHASPASGVAAATGSFTPVRSSRASPAARQRARAARGVERVDAPMRAARRGAAHVEAPAAVGGPHERRTLQRLGAEAVLVQHELGGEALAVDRAGDRRPRRRGARGRGRGRPGRSRRRRRAPRWAPRPSTPVRRPAPAPPPTPVPCPAVEGRPRRQASCAAPRRPLRVRMRHGRPHAPPRRRDEGHAERRRLRRPQLDRRAQARRRPLPGLPRRRVGRRSSRATGCRSTSATRRSRRRSTPRRRERFVVDGEVVGISGGRSSFEALQRRGHDRRVKIAFYVFDVLWLDGEDLRERPLRERKAALREALRFGDGVVRWTPYRRAHEGERLLSRGVPQPLGGPDRQARRQPVRRQAHARLAEVEVLGRAGARHRRLHRAARVARGLRRAARRLLRRRRPALRGQGRHRLRRARAAHARRAHGRARAARLALRRRRPALRATPRGSSPSSSPRSPSPSGRATGACAIRATWACATTSPRVRWCASGRREWRPNCLTEGRVPRPGGGVRDRPKLFRSMAHTPLERHRRRPAHRSLPPLDEQFEAPPSVRRTKP